MRRLKIEIPSGANEIIHTLQNNGYEAFLCGGGGHPKAAGSEFSQSIKLKVIEEIFG